MNSLLRNLLFCGLAGALLVTGGPALAAVSAHKKPVTAVSAKKAAVKPSRAPAKRSVAQTPEKKPSLAKRVNSTKAPPLRAALHDDGSGSLEDVKSAAVAVFDQSTGDLLYEKNADAVVPIASITKLMTAMVALDARPDLNEMLTISEADVDTLKGTHSRLTIGTQLSREDMLRLALMSSENRAASALARHYPGGRAAFVAAMNAKARMIGLTDTRFADPTGLTPENVSSARDLVKLVNAAHQYPLIRAFSTLDEYQVNVRGRLLTFRNTNALVRNEQWQIGLSKTGYISEAGKCLVMQAWLDNKPTIIVLLDSWGKLTRIGDANRIKRWVESLASNGRAAPVRG